MKVGDIPVYEFQWITPADVLIMAQNGMKQDEVLARLFAKGPFGPGVWKRLSSSSLLYQEAWTGWL